MYALNTPLHGRYARCYLARAGGKALPGHRTYLMSSIYDYLFTFNQLGGHNAQGGGEGGGEDKQGEDGEEEGEEGGKAAGGKVPHLLLDADFILPEEIDSGKGMKMKAYVFIRLSVYIS